LSRVELFADRVMVAGVAKRRLDVAVRQ
jgi:hypothetical protein